MNAYKQKLKIAVLAGLMGAGALFHCTAADLTAVRATNEMGQTRVVLDMQGLPDGWSSIYNEKAQQLKVHLRDTTNKTTGPVQYNNRTTGVLKGVSLSTTDDGLDMSLTVNQNVRHHIFTLNQPDRVVLDLFNTYEQRTMKTLKSGVTYTQWDTNTDTGRVKVDVLEFVPSEGGKRIEAAGDGEVLQDVAPAGAIAVGLVNVDTVRDKFSAEDINGKIEPERGQADGVNILKASAITPTAMIQYIPSQGYVFSLETPTLQLTEGETSYIVNGVNKPRGENELIAYNTDYGTYTHTNVYGQEVTIRKNVVVAKTKANSPITTGDIVLSAHGTMIPVLDKLMIGDVVDLQIIKPVVSISRAGTLVAEGQAIVLRDSVVTGHDDGQFRGRTLLGVKPDGTLIVLAATGNYRAYTGITLPQGGRLLKNLGAINGLDIGGQTDTDIWVNGTYLHRDQTANGPAQYTHFLIFPQ